ncbi:flagellin [bacterium]|nr:flagellin [bacterium]
MKNNVNMLNKTIERMTTGYKINYAKDNAANYSISTNMTTKIRGYQIAEDNVLMGLDMLTTANDSLELMQNHATHLRELAIQAKNGTYGGNSLKAIQEEANSIYNEINRLYSTAEYNEIGLFERKPYEIAEHLKTAGMINGGLIEGIEDLNGFIKNPYDYDQSYVDKLTAVSEVNAVFTKSEYKIEDVNDLEKLRTLVNNGIDTSGITFILANDINLKEYCDSLGVQGWVPIGTSINPFKGNFNGNGHIISNLYINRISMRQGFWGATQGGKIENLGLIDVSINASGVSGGLVGELGSQDVNTDIENCYVIGELKATTQIGLLVGHTARGNLCDSCYAKGKVSGTTQYVGGLIGLFNGTITNSFTDVETVTSLNSVNNLSAVGGLVGYSEGVISNCYALGNVHGKGNRVGGLVGDCRSMIENSFARGNVFGEGISTGGLAGYTRGSIISSYASGNVNGSNFVGGLVGTLYRDNYAKNIENCSAYGQVKGVDFNSTGSYIGGIQLLDKDTAIININNLESISQDYKLIGGFFNTSNTIIDYDISDTQLSGVNQIHLQKVSTDLQIGISSESASQININTNFEYDLGKIVRNGISTTSALNTIDKFIDKLNEKQAEIGAVQNRLISALEEISTQHENLVSSRSTLRDADMAKVSSTYIQQQILQEVSVTLMETANQNPSIALQLI